MRDRRERDRALRDRDRERDRVAQDDEEERRAATERRGEELREAWRKHHPERGREKGQSRKGKPA